MVTKNCFPMLSIILTIMSFFVIPSYSCGAVVQYENQIVDTFDISVLGADSGAGYHENSIRDRMKTREGQPFSQVEFDRDLKALSGDYDRIAPDLGIVDGKLHISLELWPKPAIRQVVLEGNCKLSSKELHKELGIAVPSTFNGQEFNKAFHKLKTYYIQKGFFEAQLNYTICPVEETNEVDIMICIEEGRAGRIKEILFKCFTCDEREDLLDMMVTKKYNFFISWLSGTGTYNEEAVQQDQFIILNYLQNKGYADAEVEIEVCEAKQNNRIVIVITATRGPRYHFGEITFEGNSIYSDEEICTHILAKEGCPYSPEMIRNSMQSVTNLYGRCGYIEAYVNYEPKLACDECVYSVHFTIDEGEQYRVGLIKVIGNSCTQTNVILHETLLCPGEVFNLDKMSRTERRLCNVGYFSNVNAYAVRTDDEPSCLGGNYRDVHIEVEETSTGNFGAFAGFSTSENMFGGFNVTEKNFNISGLGCLSKYGTRALRGGGEYASFSTTVGQKSRKYQLSWTKPYFMDTPWAVGFDIERSSNRYISDAYDINATGFNLHGIYDYNAYVNVGVHYRIRNACIELVKKKKAEPQLVREAKEKGLVSAVGATWMYDSTNSIMRPTCGLKSRFETELAGLGGDYSFFSVAYLNTYYYQLGERDVLKFRADARFIQPFWETGGDDLPIDERIFLGGENEIRGYRPYSLGPKFDHDDDEPRGGISMQILSAEYQRRIFPIMDAFVFVDAGHLSLAHWDFGRLYTSVGFGARLQIMGNGPPLTVGMGYPINSKDRSDVKKFFMTVGGRF
jgi:outer membrane protein insertion porin family